MEQPADTILFYAQGMAQAERDFGKVLRSARMGVGMSQTELAKESQTLQYYISNLETGVDKNPSLDIIQRIAAAMGYTIRVEFISNPAVTSALKSHKRNLGCGRPRVSERKSRHRLGNNKELMGSYMLEFLINKGKCHICGERFTKVDPPTLDHVIAAAREGTHEVSNAAAAHGKCNSAKNANRTHLI